MESQTTYIVIGVLFSVYLLITMLNKRKSKTRNSREFMGSYKRKKKESDE